MKEVKLGKLTRRDALLTLAVLPLAVRTADAARGSDDAAAQFAALENRLGGRLGIAVRDTGNGRTLLHREDEAFPLCSTFKALAAAAVLARVDRGLERLDRELGYEAADLDAYAPIAKSVLDAQGGKQARMRLDAACAAAVEWSDNTAANLMLWVLGGPEGLTAYLRGLGDATSRLDRIEPSLNSAIPGDPRDTTSPAAMVGNLDRLLLGDALSGESRARLEAWMVGAKTGGKRLRAGLPPDWGVGDKTGTGDYATANVVAILRPPGRAPILAAVYMTGSAEPAAERDAGHAEIGRIVAAWSQAGSER